MPILRSRSGSRNAIRTTRSTGKENVSLNSRESGENANTKPVRSALKQSNNANVRLTRSSSRKGRTTSIKRDSSKAEKHAPARKPASTSENKTAASVAPPVPKRVITRRTRRTEPPKAPDPYAFDLFACSDDEKENIDPKGAVMGKAKATAKVTKPPHSDADKQSRVRPKPTNLANAVFASPIAPLTGRPMHFGSIKRPVVPASPRRVDPSLTEMERRKSAAATILLALPRTQQIIHDSSIFSVTSLTPGHMLSASTPANPVPSTSSHSARTMPASDPKVILSPLSMTPPVSRAAAPVVSLPTDQGALLPGELNQSSVTSPSHSVSEEKKDTSHGSGDHSTSSGASSGHRRRRQSAEEKRKEAYDSWLEEFNAQLDKFESHELTVVEDQPSS